MLAMFMCIGLSGCNPQSITPAQIKQQVTEKRAALLEAATTLQANASQLSTQLQSAGITDANISNKIASMNAKRQSISLMQII
jgi:hypothetical protein